MTRDPVFVYTDLGVELEPHPVAAWFPMLSEDELALLAESIRQNGLIDPIVVHDGQILDGRNRLAACKLAGVDPMFVKWALAESQIVPWIIGKNLHRRHLTTSQRAALAARLATLDQGRPETGKSAGIPTQAEAAKLLGVSERSVRDARAVLEHGSPELVARVDAGEVTVSAAAAEVRPKREGWFPPAEPASAAPTPAPEQAEATARVLAQASSAELCGEPHPSRDREGETCTEPKGHVWSHGFMDGRDRIGWRNTGVSIGQQLAAEVRRPDADGPATADLEPELAGHLASIDEEDDDSDEGLIMVGSGAAPPAPPAPLPLDERAPGDAYWTPDATARACVRWLLGHTDLPEGFSTIEPAVGGGSWVRSLHELAPLAAVDRMDLDPAAPGLAGLRDDDKAWPGQSWLDPRSGQWDLCLGNPPYGGDLVRWLEISLGRARVVAYLLRETVTGSIERLPWWLEHRPAWIAKVLPRPRWEGPGQRETSDYSDHVLVVWVRGVTETRWDWIDCREGRP